MRILVTGAFGYLGSSLVLHLLKKNFKVIALDKMNFGLPSVFYKYRKNLEIIKGDIGDINLIKKCLKKTDKLIHLAGIVGEQACKQNIKLSKKTNYHDVIKIIKLCDISNLKHFIYVSTCSNYGLSKIAEYLDEDALLQPLSIYSKQKVKVEKYLIKNYNNNYTILRLGTLCGLSPRMRFDLLINEICRDLAVGRKITLYSPSSWRPYLAIEDAVISLEKILKAKKKTVKNQIFNIVGENLKKIDLIKKISNLTNKKIKYKELKVSTDIRDYKVTGNKFIKVFGKMKNKCINKAIIEIYKSIKNEYFYDPFSKKHTALKKANR